MSVLYLKNNQGIWEEVSTINGHTPVITASKSNGITTIYADGTTVATINDGEKGEKGEDGETPLSAFPNDTVSGQIVHITDGADNIPMDSVKVKIEPVQDLHGQDAPYPAGGKGNLFQTTATSKTDNGITWTVNADGSVTASGTPTDYSSITLGEAIVDGISESVTIHVDVSSTYNIEIGNIILYDANNTQLARIYSGGFATTHTVDLSQYSNPHRITVLLKRNNDNVAVNNTYHVQVVKGTTVGDWYPYSNVCPISGWTGAQVSHSGADRTNPTTYSITFPSEADTVYGGTLNVTNGTLTVNRAMVDLGTLNWSAYTLASNCFKAVLSDGKATRTNYSADGACSSYAKADYITTLRDTDKTFGIGYTHLSANVCYVAVHDSSYSDATAFKTAMNGVQLCYELATPITYTLTPTEIKSLYGENNIYTDCGSTSVTYRADTTSYIGKIITATKSGTVTTVYVKDKPIATITDGANGKDYTLTTQDKEDIAQQVINILPTAQGVSF